MKKLVIFIGFLLGMLPPFSSPVVAQEIALAEDSFTLFARNLQCYATLTDGNKVAIHRDVPLTRVQELEFCWAIDKHTLPPTKKIDLYLVFRNQSGSWIYTHPSVSGVFQKAGGQELEYTRHIRLSPKEDNPIAEVCFPYAQEQEYLFGLHYADLYYEGKLIKRKRLLLR